MDCPVCGKHHILEKGIDGIYENRYILKNIRKPQSKCEKHDREFILFCDENGCKQVICSMCMREDHNHHSSKIWKMQQLSDGTLGEQRRRSKERRKSQKRNAAGKLEEKLIKMLRIVWLKLNRIPTNLSKRSGVDQIC